MSADDAGRSWLDVLVLVTLALILAALILAAVELLT